MQDKAEAMKSYLKDLLTGDSRPEDREERARWFHDHGYYWYAVLINLDTIQRLRAALSVDEIWRRRAFLLSSAAGIRGASNIPELILSEPMSSRPLPMLNLANLHLARGHLKAGRAALRNAQDILEAIPSGPAKELARKQLEAAFDRRQSQINHLSGDGLKAVEGARHAVERAESDYSLDTGDTGHVILAISSVSSGEYDHTEAALAHLELRQQKLSWLYKAEKLFVKGIHNVLAGCLNPADVYVQLTEAQYIYILLGLQMSLSPKLNLASPQGRSWEWTPADVLLSTFASLPTHKRLSESDCFQLREIALRRMRPVSEKPLYEQLLDPLCGRDGAPQPRPGHSLRE